MSPEPNLDREIIRRQRRVRTDVEPLVYNVPRFCDAHEISRTQLFKRWKRGLSPRFFWQGRQRRINSAEAAAEIAQSAKPRPNFEEELRATDLSQGGGRPFRPNAGQATGVTPW